MPEGISIRTPEPKKTSEERAVRLSRDLEASKDPEFIKRHLPELFSLLETELGVTLLKGGAVQKVYSLFQEENCLVRVENFTTIMEALELNRNFKVGASADDSHYANAVIPDMEGIQLAFAEGQAPGSLRLAIGLGKPLVGFKANSEHLRVSDVEFSEDDKRDVAKRAHLCRHVEGEVTKEDIHGVVMRIPRNVVEDSLLTNEELENEARFVFRGFITKNTTSPQEGPPNSL